jgi:hypothetical protein
MSRTQGRAAPTLPHEILTEILKIDVALAYVTTLTYSPSRSSQTSHACSSVGAYLVSAQRRLASHMMVCRGWRDSGLYILLSMPIVTSWPQLRNLHRTLRVKDSDTQHATTRGLIIEDFIIENLDDLMPGHLSSEDDDTMSGYVQECRAVLEDLLARYARAPLRLHLWANLAGTTHRLLGYPLIQSIAMSVSGQNLRGLSLRGSVLFNSNTNRQETTDGWPGILPQLDELSIRETFLPLDFVISSHRLPSLTKLRMMHCHWAETSSIFPPSATGPHLTHLEFLYTMTDDRSLAATIRDHANSLTSLTLIGKSELRAFSRLIATETSIGEAQLTDPFVGPNYAVAGPARLDHLRELTVSVIASPESRHFDFALNAWQLPKGLERLVIARRRWSEWRDSDFTTKDLTGIRQALAHHLTNQTPTLRAIQVEGTFPSGAEHEMEVLQEVAELCSLNGVSYHLTGRTVAEAISAFIADPRWELNQLV